MLVAAMTTCIPLCSTLTPRRESRQLCGSEGDASSAAEAIFTLAIVPHIQAFDDHLCTTFSPTSDDQVYTSKESSGHGRMQKCTSGRAEQVTETCQHTMFPRCGSGGRQQNCAELNSYTVPERIARAVPSLLFSPGCDASLVSYWISKERPGFVICCHILDFAQVL